MIYEVWDSESANIVGAFDSEAEALDAIGRALQEHGPTYVASLAFGTEDGAGESTMIATGPELVERAEQHLSRAPLRHPAD